MTKQMMVLLALLLYILVKGLFIEPNSLTVTKYKVESSYLQGVKIAFLSDLHLGRADYKRTDAIVKETNAQNPDAVFLGGGYGKGSNLQKSMKPDILANKLSFIKAQKYAVLAASDWAAGGRSYISAFLQNRIAYLENSNTRRNIRGKYVDVIGLADVTARQPNIATAFAMTDMPRLVITHNPDIYYEIMDDASLIMAGHTHGGHFILPFTPAMFVASKYGSEFASGLLLPRRNPILISKGIGVDKIPFRFNCKPEIVVVEFVAIGAGTDYTDRKQ